MNMQKHMEAIFVVTLVVVTSSTFALDSLREADESVAALARDSAAHDVRTARTVIVRAPTLPQRA